MIGATVCDEITKEVGEEIHKSPQKQHCVIVYRLITTEATGKVQIPCRRRRRRCRLHLAEFSASAFV